MSMSSSRIRIRTSLAFSTVLLGAAVLIVDRIYAAMMVSASMLITTEIDILQIPLFTCFKPYRFAIKKLAIYRTRTINGRGFYSKIIFWATGSGLHSREALIQKILVTSE